MNTKSIISKVSKNLPTLKIQSIGLTIDTFPELDRFREGLLNEQEGNLNAPYTALKQRTLFYRAAFTLVGGFFFLLAYFVSTMNPLAVCHQFFHNCAIVHGSILLTTLFVAFGSCTMALYLKPETEALRKITRRAKEKINLLFAIKNMGENNSCPHVAMIRKQALDELRRSKESARYLLMKIASSPKLAQLKKENLFNQTLSEFEERLERLHARLRSMPASREALPPRT